MGSKKKTYTQKAGSEELNPEKFSYFIKQLPESINIVNYQDSDFLSQYETIAVHCKGISIGL